MNNNSNKTTDPCAPLMDHRRFLHYTCRGMAGVMLCNNESRVVSDRDGEVRCLWPTV